MKTTKLLKLVYLPYKHMTCIQHPHYDLCTVEEQPSNIGCLLLDKEGAKLIRKWIKRHNQEIKA